MPTNLLLFLFERQTEKKKDEHKEQRDLSTCLYCKFPQQPGLGQVEVRSLIRNLSLLCEGARGVNYLGHFFLPLGVCASRKPESEEELGVEDGHLNMAYRHSKK